MPTKTLPENPSLTHLKQQAKDLLKAHAARDPQALQRLREFHPRLKGAADDTIAASTLRLSDAQLSIAREYGFASWTRLRSHIESPTREDLHLPHHERITDPLFRKAVDLLDCGKADQLRTLLREHPELAHRRVLFEGGNYFRTPTLLEFVAENPIRHGRLPANIVQVARVILEAGPSQNSKDEALGLVCSGRVPRECGVQSELIDLLCDFGADPNAALGAALGHGEFEAVRALLRKGGRLDLMSAAAMGRVDDVRRLLPASDAEQRHAALALAAQFGHAEVLKLLLEAGEDPNRYNPEGFHSHSTPLHQAALAGHFEAVRVLVESGARLDMPDVIYQANAAGWAQHAGQTEVAAYLREKTA